MALRFILLLVLLACSGCGGNDERELGQQVEFVVSPSFVEPPAPGSRGFVYWIADDYAFVFGDVEVRDSQAIVTLSQNVPPEGRLGDLGAGVIVVHTGEAVEPGLHAPGNSLVDSSAYVAMSHEFALIYRESPEPLPPYDWVELFPTGYSCGRCVRPDGGMHGYEPVSCDAIELTPFGQGNQVCNWH